MMQSSVGGIAVDQFMVLCWVAVRLDLVDEVIVYFHVEVMLGLCWDHEQLKGLFFVTTQYRQICQ